MIAKNSYLKIIILCALVIGLILTGYFKESSRPSSRSDWKMISPFTAVSFENEMVFAEYEGTTYELVSIEGIESRELVKAAKNRFGRLWQKRIREDISEVLSAAGMPDSTRVDLKLKERQSGEVRNVSDAEMTKENRSKIKKSS